MSVIPMRLLFAVDVLEGCIVMSFAALPSARAVAVISSLADQRCSLMLVEGGKAAFRPIDDTLVVPTLARLGDGFALLTRTGVTKWAYFGAEPVRFRRIDAFPKNEHGFAVGVHRGGLSDDPNAALVLLHEPQFIDGATRYALLRLDEASASARWEWTHPSGEPPALDKEDFPIPDFWRSSSSFADVRPFLDHGSWIGGRLRLFALGGLNANFVRWGMDYSIAAVVERGRVVERWVAPEPSWGFFASSRRHLITRPLRKGAASVLDLDSHEQHTLGLPRGYSKFVLTDCCDGTFWSMDAGTNRIAAFANA